VPRQIVREYLYVYAAVCPDLGRMTALLLPWANTDMMNIFLEEVSKDFSEFLVIMQVDQAGWHKSKNLKIPENIRLLPQPPYSPELNPVEHLWEELREKACPNKAFKSLREVEHALCEEIGRLQNDPVRLRSLTNFPHLRIPC
jgi:putative transposase